MGVNLIRCQLTLNSEFWRNILMNPNEIDTGEF